MKYREGLYNKAFLITFDNSSEVVAKIPNPNAGPNIFTTASEVATINYVRSISYSYMLLYFTILINDRCAKLLDPPCRIS